MGDDFHHQGENGRPKSSNSSISKFSGVGEDDSKQMGFKFVIEKKGSSAAGGYLLKLDFRDFLRR